MKKYVIYAGVNGAGKSTFYNMKSQYNLPRVNTDEIVKEFGDWKNVTDVMRAGKIAVKRIDEYLSQGISFNQETTLCGHSIFRNIERAKKEGYVIELFYVGLDSAEIAKERIAKRVERGGHGIPDEDVERRYVESLKNLRRAIELCDLVSINDNTETMRRFAIYRNGQLCLLSRNVPEWFRRTEIENVLDETDYLADSDAERYTHEEVFSRLKDKNNN